LGKEVNQYYNHKQRKRIVKDSLKNEKIPIEGWVRGISGEMEKQIIGWTTKWKEMKKHEKNNTKDWFERVNKSVEYGKQLERAITEINYNQWSQEVEARENKNLEEYIMEYGEEKGRELHEKHLLKIEEKMLKKNDL
jgi:hypothetical protein